MTEPPHTPHSHFEIAEQRTPHLPPELEGYIFELATSLSLSTAAALLLVARRTSEWVYPTLYETIVIYPQDHRPFKFTNTTRTFQQYGRYVRHLLISSAATEDELANLTVYPDKITFLLSNCPYLTNLALWCGPITASVMKSLQTLPLCRLSVDIGQGRLLDMPAPIFPHLTHLELISPSKADNSCVLAKCPKLTHVAVGELEAVDHVVKGVVDNCLTLTTFVIVGYGFNREVVLVDQFREDPRDSRIVGIYCDYVFDWLRGVAGGRDMWKAAEEELARRRSLRDD